MLLQKTPDFRYTLELRREESIALANSINYIIEDLAEELLTRTGFTKEEYRQLVVKINRPPKKITCSKVEVIMLHQALNEICSGILVDSFTLRIGLPLFEVKKILSTLDCGLQK